MCGRTCLTLEPNEVLCACKYKSTARKPKANEKEPRTTNSDRTAAASEQKEESKDAVEQLLQPEWRSEFNCGRSYAPSYNIAPSDITPVLVSTMHFSDDAASEPELQSRVVVPMMWGMVPFWHKGDYHKHGLKTNNCRLEHMLNSKLYRGPFLRGQRCVVLCEGFYEWQTTKSAKPSERAAHLLYMPQTDDAVKIYDRTTWTPDNVNLLKMAGLFDVWEDEHGDKIYSYSIITFEASKIMSWMHYRMPAILETDQQISDWLDFKRVTIDQALGTLRPATNLRWHQVANVVNNSRNKSDQCNKPIEQVRGKKSMITTMNKTMLGWLNVRKRREEKTAKGEQPVESDEDAKCGGNKSSGSGTTSESEDENPPKRLRFRDFKNIKAHENAGHSSRKEESGSGQSSSKASRIQSKKP